MPWTTIVSGTPITAAWANANVRDQTVAIFANAAARAAAIPSPSNGQPSYLQDTRALEIWVSSTTGWRAPWNLPWGNLTHALSNTTGALAAGVGGTEASPTPLRTTAVAIPANRKIQVIGTCHFVGSGAIAPTMRVRRGAGTGGTEVFSSKIRLPDVFGGQGPLTLTVVDTGYTPGASVQWSFTGVDADIYGPWQWQVNDLGPNGAPA